jgi:hypothetical protein
MSDCSVALAEGAKAKEQVIHHHHRATVKPRQEGFEAKDEETRSLKISSTEYMSGDVAVHVDSKTKVARKAKLSGVRKFCINYRNDYITLYNKLLFVICSYLDICTRRVSNRLFYRFI